MIVAFQKINRFKLWFFSIADVDTHEPDEKSLITYISSLHEVFPEPPPIHPLYDSAAQQRMQEYREIASSLQMWMREKYSLMQVSGFDRFYMHSNRSYLVALVVQMHRKQ